MWMIPDQQKTRLYLRGGQAIRQWCRLAGKCSIWASVAARSGFEVLMNSESWKALDMLQLNGGQCGSRNGSSSC